MSINMTYFILYDISFMYNYIYILYTEIYLIIDLIKVLYYVIVIV